MDLCIENTFSTKYYLDNYPDIKKSGSTPLIHYFLNGRKEGRRGIK